MPFDSASCLVLLSVLTLKPTTLEPLVIAKLISEEVIPPTP